MLDSAALAYDFTRHEHYEHLSSCEHGLSSTIRIYAPRSDYPNVINDTFLLYVFLVQYTMVFIRKLRYKMLIIKFITKNMFLKIRQSF